MHSGKSSVHVVCKKEMIRAVLLFVRTVPFFSVNVPLGRPCTILCAKRKKRFRLVVVFLSLLVNATDAVFDSSFTTCHIFGTFACKCQIKLCVIGIEMAIRIVVHGETGARLAQFKFEIRISCIKNVHSVKY